MKSAKARLPTSAACDNRLLAALPSAEYKRLAPKFERVWLDFEQVLAEPGEPIEYVYFPCGSLICLLTVQDNGKPAAEAGIVGRRGMTGLPAFLGGDRTLFRQCVQVPGEALRLPAKAFRRMVGQPGQFAKLVGRHALAFVTMMGHYGACALSHHAEARLCRWWLWAHDEAPTDPYRVTHEFLAMMLGANRATVSTIMSRLQRRGLIHNRRGKVRILNRDGLEAIACSCYARVRNEYERLLTASG